MEDRYWCVIIIAIIVCMGSLLLEQHITDEQKLQNALYTQTNVAQPGVVMSKWVETTTHQMNGGQIFNQTYYCVRVSIHGRLNPVGVDSQDPKLYNTLDVGQAVMYFNGTVKPV
jgi:hypothetical protein